MPTITTTPAMTGNDIPMKRRRGRPSKTSNTTPLPESVVTVKHFLGYSLTKDQNGFSVCQDYEEQRGQERTVKTETTHIRLPQSTEERMSDTAFHDEVMGYAQRVRHELGKRDNYKLHLQKDAPDHVYFSYSIDGAPTTELFIHPSRVDVSVHAFENEEEHESFLKAVAHQNFSNKAYKKWREAVREQFIDDVISQELVKQFGNEAERLESQRAAGVAMYGHKGAKAATVEESVVIPTSSTPPVAIPASEPSVPAIPLLLDIPHTPTISIEGGEGVIPHPEPEAVSQPVNPPKIIKRRPRPIIPASLPAPINHANNSAVLSEYVEAKKLYIAVSATLKPFEGILGSFRKELQRDEYIKQAKQYREAKERYDRAHQDYSVFIITRQIATMLGALAINPTVQRRFSSLTSWVFQGQSTFSKTRLGHILTGEHYDYYEAWVRRSTSNIDIQLEARTLLNTITVEGYVLSSLLGATLGISGDKDPQQTIRIAAAASSDLVLLRKGLSESFGIEACRVPEMTFTQRRTLEDMVNVEHMRNMVAMLEFHARLRGEILSMERHHTTYCDLYTQLHAKYTHVVSNPEGMVSITEALGDEKTSIALLENLLHQGKTLKEYANVKVDGMKFLDTIARDPFPQHLHDVSRVYSLSRWKGTVMGQVATRIWETWHHRGGIEKAGMNYIELAPSETLLGALRRIVWAHSELFPGQEGGEQKVYMALRQVYEQMGFGTVPDNPNQWLRLGNAGDRIYVDAKGQIWYANTSGKEAGFLEIDEFEGFTSGTPESVLWKLIHDESVDVFLDYIQEFPEVFVNYYEKKIDILSETSRTSLRHRLDGLRAVDHDTRHESEAYFRDFYFRHHQDPIAKGKE